MKRNLEKLRAWQRRSKQLERKTELKSTRIEPKGGKKRRSRLKPKPQPTTGFRMWVRETQVCCVPGCGRQGPDPHHVKAKGGGRRDPWRVDIRNVAPLCREHHRLGDSVGWSWKRFESEFQVDLDEVARHLWRQWMALPEETRKRWERKAYELNIRRGVPRQRARRRG